MGKKNKKKKKVLWSVMLPLPRSTGMLKSLCPPGLGPCGKQAEGSLLWLPSPVAVGVWGELKG